MYIDVQLKKCIFYTVCIMGRYKQYLQSEDLYLMVNCKFFSFILFVLWDIQTVFTVGDTEFATFPNCSFSVIAQLESFSSLLGW